MNDRTESYDVVIVGGGPAGSSAAIHLAAGGARVLLAERENFPRPKLCGEFISPECLDHFARLGVAESMNSSGGSGVAETVFYARSGRGLTVPSAWFGRGACALGLSRAAMDDRLLARARAVGVEVCEDAHPVGLLLEDEGVRGVRLSAGGAVRECRARVTIDATGRARTLARFAERDARAGERAAPKRAPLVAFKAHLENARGAEGACEIYFYRGGYGGLSPVENNLSNLCFIARASEVRACGSDPARVMREVLMTNGRAAHALRDARVKTEWLSVALEGFGRREPAPAPGLLAVGDAASFIDPFTGSGMLMALESAELAAAAITRRLRRGTDERAWLSDSDELARDYRALYEARFGARLRLCVRLRRAAFAPPLFAEAAVLALGASERVRRSLARATRRSSAAPSSPSP